MTVGKLDVFVSVAEIGDILAHAASRSTIWSQFVDTAHRDQRRVLRSCVPRGPKAAIRPAANGGRKSCTKLRASRVHTAVEATGFPVWQPSSSLIGDDYGDARRAPTGTPYAQLVQTPWGTKSATRRATFAHVAPAAAHRGQWRHRCPAARHDAERRQREDRNPVAFGLAVFTSRKCGI